MILVNCVRTAVDTLLGAIRGDLAWVGIDENDCLWVVASSETMR